MVEFERIPDAKALHRKGGAAALLVSSEPRIAKGDAASINVFRTST